MPLAASSEGRSERRSAREYFAPVASHWSGGFTLCCRAKGVGGAFVINEDKGLAKPIAHATG